MKILPTEFDGPSIRQQADYQTARKYWNKLKERLCSESRQGHQGIQESPGVELQ